MKVLVNGKPYLDRRTAFKALSVDRKYIAQVKKGLKDHGTSKIPGFEFVLMAKGTKGAAIKLAQRTETLLKEKKNGKAHPATKDPAVGSSIKETFCAICERVPFGNLIRLGFDRWRHAGCEPGSPEWCVYFEALPKAKRTNEGKLIYENAKRKGSNLI
jgi:hypothetical protein